MKPCYFWSFNMLKIFLQNKTILISPNLLISKAVHIFHGIKGRRSSSGKRVWAFMLKFFSSKVMRYIWGRWYILLYVVYRCDQGIADIVATTDISIDQANVTICKVGYWYHIIKNNGKQIWLFCYHTFCLKDLIAKIFLKKDFYWKNFLWLLWKISF